MTAERLAPIMVKYGFTRPTRLHVEPLGRFHYHVQSETRPEIKHVVDMESAMPECSCESYTIGKAMLCKHLRFIAMLQEAGLLPSKKELQKTPTKRKPLA